MAPGYIIEVVEPLDPAIVSGFRFDFRSIISPRGTFLQSVSRFAATQADVGDEELDTRVYVLAGVAWAAVSAPTSALKLAFFVVEVFVTPVQGVASAWSGWPPLELAPCRLLGVAVGHIWRRVVRVLRVGPFDQ